MKLCDDCIKKLGNNLSNQAEQTLEELSSVLIDKGLTGMGFEQTTELDRNAVKSIIDELESRLFLDHDLKKGRRKVFYLTESGQRFLELQKESEKEEIVNEDVEEKVIDEDKVDKLDKKIKESTDSTDELTEEIKKFAKMQGTEIDNQDTEVVILEQSDSLEELQAEVTLDEEQESEDEKEENKTEKVEETEEGSEPLIWNFDL
ncbi:hypothetical protein JCM16358_26200 [Halanaerocella petrolearia]